MKRRLFVATIATAGLALVMPAVGAQASVASARPAVSHSSFQGGNDFGGGFGGGAWNDGWRGCRKSCWHGGCWNDCRRGCRKSCWRDGGHWDNCWRSSCRKSCWHGGSWNNYGW